MSILFEPDSIIRPRNVAGGSTTKPGHTPDAVIHNRNVPSGATIGPALNPTLGSGSFARERGIPAPSLTYDSGSYQPQNPGSGGDSGAGTGGQNTGGGGAESWVIDEFGHARLSSLSIGSASSADTRLESTGTGAMGLSAGDSFTVGEGIKLSGDNYIEMVNVGIGVPSPTRIQSKLFSGPSGTSATVTLDNATQDASTVLIVLYTPTGSTHTPPAGWTSDVTRSSTAARISIYRKYIATGAAFSQAITWSANSAYRIEVIEVTDIINSSPLDETASNTGSVVHTPPYVVSATSKNLVAASSANVAIPIGTQPNDLIIVVFNGFGASTYPLVTFSPSISSFASNTRFISGTGFQRVIMLRRVYTGTDPTDSWPMTFSVPATGEVIMVAIRGAHTSAPINVVDDVFTETTSATSHNISAVATTVADTLLMLAGGGTASGAGTLGADPSGMTKVLGDANQKNTYIYSEARPTSGATGNRAVTTTSASSEAAIMFAITPGTTGSATGIASTGITAALSEGSQYALAAIGASSPTPISYSAPTGGFNGFDDTPSTLVLLSAERTTDTTAVSSSRGLNGSVPLNWLGVVATYKPPATSISPASGSAWLIASAAAGSTEIAMAKSNGDVVPWGSTFDFEVQLGADFGVTNSNTLATVTGMTLDMATDEIWHIELDASMLANNSTGSGDLEFVMTSGTIATVTSYYEGNVFNVTGLTTLSPAAATSTTSILAGASTAGGITVCRAANTPSPCHIQAWLWCDSSGTLAVRIANNNAAAGRTTIMEKGSIFRANRVGIS